MDRLPLAILYTYILNEDIIGIVSLCGKVTFLRFLFSPGKTAKLVFAADRRFGFKRPRARKD